MTMEKTKNTSQRSKRKRIPSTHKISKRPAYRPLIASPYSSSSSQKIIYITANTPFISAVKRVRKLLDLIESRAVQAVTTQVRNAQPVRGQGKGSGKVNSKGKGKSAVEKDNGRNIEEEVKLLGKTKKEEVVFLKGMGKAIDKTLQLGLYFQGQKDLKIRVKTGTVEVVDDVVEGEKDGEGDVDKEKEGEKVGDKAVGDKMDVDEEEVPDTQVRMTSMVEIAVGFR